MKKKAAAKVAAVLFLSMLMGCATLTNPGAPDQSFDENKDIQALEQRFGQANAITKYYEGAQTVEARNEFIAGRLTLINLQYIKFIRKFAVNKAQLDTAFDMLIAGVGLATTVAGGEVVKSALGAATAGLSATRTSIDKNFFYEKTVPALITAMNAQRKVVLIAILGGIKRDLASYPMPQALSDLSEYYFAGTFTGALQAIEKDASVKDAAADERIEIIRSPAAAASVASVTVRDKVKELQIRIDALSDQQALTLAKNPPVESQALDQILLKQDPTKPWTTNPVAARKALKFRVTMMIDPVNDVPKWDKALP